MVMYKKAIKMKRHLMGRVDVFKQLRQQAYHYSPKMNTPSSPLPYLTLDLRSSRADGA